ncbi:excisionase family DNA-binding protein [Sellimonas intestinalis]|uniref:excisionase family DNA-binding protein n=1 Tax=Sellimonas intestinalis TaxID=1653434 RepID=UPI003AB6A927
MDYKETMSVQELSARMGISLQKAYQLVKTPGFPTLRVGTRILIPVEAYKEWLLRTSLNETK